MGAFKGAVITKKGQELLAKVVYGACKVEFTQIKTSENILTGDLDTRTDIGTVKQAEKVSSIVKQNEYNVKVSTSFTNKKLTAGYYIRNIGLYAMDPTEGEILYSVSVADESTATADWMPPNNGTGVSSLMVDLITAVSTASSVNLTVDPTATATVAQILEVNERVTALANAVTTTTERTLRGSVAGGVKVNKIIGKCEQGADPTPDAPKEIKSAVVNKITACGRNIYTGTYSKAYYSASGEITNTGGTRLSDFIRIDGKPITFYAKRTAEGDALRICAFDKDKKFIERKDISKSDYGYYENASAVYVRVGIFEDHYDGDTMMVYFGAELLPYEPHKENYISLSKPFELCSIGGVADEITPNEVIRRVNKKVLNGAEIWNMISDGYFVMYTSTNKFTAKTGDGLCSHYSYSVPSFYVGEAGIAFTKADCHSIDEWKAYLSAQYTAGTPVTVYYLPTEPTTETLPVSDQLAIRSLLSYDETTNIFAESDVAPVMEVEYGTNKVGAHTLTGLLTAQRNELKLAELTA